MNLLQKMKAAEEAEQSQAGQAQALALAACSPAVSSAKLREMAGVAERRAARYIGEGRTKDASDYAFIGSILRDYAEKEAANERQPQENDVHEPTRRTDPSIQK